MQRFSVRNSGNAFAWLDPSADIQFIKNRCLRMRVNVILSEENLSWPSNSSYNYDETTKIWVSFLPYSDSLNIFGPNFVYAICTSGSTGDPKVVHVTESAIMPNIHDFV
jgi:acyl-CoA synthetase (AMP-forming)/AMP-acid ligase II